MRQCGARPALVQNEVWRAGGLAALAARGPGSPAFVQLSQDGRCRSHAGRAGAGRGPPPPLAVPQWGRGSARPCAARMLAAIAPWRSAARGGGPVRVGAPSPPRPRGGGVWGRAAQAQAQSLRWGAHWGGVCAAEGCAQHLPGGGSSHSPYLSVIYAAPAWWSYSCGREVKGLACAAATQLRPSRLGLGESGRREAQAMHRGASRLWGPRGERWGLEAEKGRVGHPVVLTQPPTSLVPAT